MKRLVSLAKFLFLLASAAAVVILMMGRPGRYGQMARQLFPAKQPAYRTSSIDPDRPVLRRMPPERPDIAKDSLSPESMSPAPKIPPHVTTLTGKWRGTTVVAKRQSFCTILLTIKQEGAQVRLVHRMDCVGVPPPHRQIVVTGAVGTVYSAGATLPDSKMLYRSPSALACTIKDLELEQLPGGPLMAHWADSVCGDVDGVPLTRVVQ